MMAFPGMLMEAAKQAGMKVPSDPDKYNMQEFPHFYVFCEVQLGRSLTSWTEHWDNAKVVAKVPEKEIRTITVQGLIDKGLRTVVG